MNVSTRRWLFACLVLAFVTAPAALLILSEFSVAGGTPVRPNAAAADWFNNLPDDELAQAQVNIKQLPSARQLFIVRTLSPQAQSEFWRSHLRTRVANDAALSREAVSAINATIDTLSPELYAEPDRFVGAREAAVARLTAAVDQRTLDGLLYLPGEAVPTKGLVAKALETPFMTWLRQKVVVSAQFPECHCVQEWWLSCGFTSIGCEYPAQCNPGDTSCYYGPWAGSGNCYGLCGNPHQG